MRESKKSISNADQVREQVLAGYQLSVRNALIAQVMKSKFAMKYQKTRPIPLQTNRERNLALRCLYGQKFLQTLEEGHRIINIDQSWLNQDDFRRNKWVTADQSQRLPMKEISPRISMIAAICSRGQCYLSLTQVNTDSDIMKLFLDRLCQILSKENPAYRDNTVFLLDGAAYHRSGMTREFYKKLQVKIMLSAPYSYSGAPIESFFGYFK